MSAERYPLYWPEGQPRSRNRYDAAFKVDFCRARDELLHSIQLLGGRGVVLSTNVALRHDGLPYANMPEPMDPGVAVYFDRRMGQDLKPFVIACDHYRKVRWNLRAVGATVEALRSIQRHGATSMLEQAFTGFAALPPAQTQKPWWEVLGVTANASADDVRRAVRELATTHHPDRGGDPSRMVEINQAYDQAIRATG